MLLRSAKKRQPPYATPRPPKRRRLLDASIPAYAYTPLQYSTSAFRVLELLPAPTKDAPLRGILHVENLCASDLISYEALSYCWGDEEKPDKIDISGTQLSIGSSLDDALRNFRRMTRSRRLWADAISINQADEAERGHQVSHMADIYRRAVRTLAWLGAPYLYDDPYVQVHVEMWRDMGSRSRNYIPHRVREYGLSVMGAIKSTLPKSPYFTRKWCIQEVGVAKHVQFWWCGHMLNGKELALAANRASRLAGVENTGFIRMLQMKVPSLRFPGREERMWGRLETVTRILYALDDFKHFQCRDAKDHIAALNWLSDLEPAYHVDYTMSVYEVYARFAGAIAKHSGHSAITLLSHAARTQHRDRPTWPSWVPDWRRPLASPSIYALVDFKGRSTASDCFAATAHDLRRHLNVAAERNSWVKLTLSVADCRTVAVRICEDKDANASRSKHPLDAHTPEVANSSIQEGDHIFILPEMCLPWEHESPEANRPISGNGFGGDPFSRTSDGVTMGIFHFAVVLRRDESATSWKVISCIAVKPNRFSNAPRPFGPPMEFLIL